MADTTDPAGQPRPDDPPHQDVPGQLTIFDALDEETPDETHR